MRPLLRVWKRLLSGVPLWRHTPIGCLLACADRHSYVCSGVSLDARTRVRLLSTTAWSSTGHGRAADFCRTHRLTCPRDEQKLIGEDACEVEYRGGGHGGRT